MNAPKNERQMLSVRIPTEMNERLGEHTRKLGVSKSQYILMLINEAIKGGQNDARTA